MWTRSHSRPLFGPVAVTDAKGHLQPTTVQGLARVGEGISWREGGVPGWVVLWSVQRSEKLATTQDKHKQGHPLGRLTPRASVDACQPGLWPGGVGMAAEHPSRHPKSMGSPQWKVCISPHGAHCG